MLKVPVAKTAAFFITALALTPPASMAIEDCGTSVTECEFRQQIKDLQQRVGTLEKKLQALELRWKFRQQIKDLQQRVGTLEKTKQILQQRVGRLEKTIQALLRALQTPQSCQKIKENAPTSSDGIYQIDPDGNGGNESFKVYCDMTTNNGGWALAGFIERTSDNGYGDYFWGRDQGAWDTGNHTHSMISLDYSDYNGDAKGRAWGSVSGNAMMLQCSAEHADWRISPGLLEFGEFSSLASFFASSNTFEVTESGGNSFFYRDNEATIVVNHSKARLYHKGHSYYGGRKRDIDGNCDAYLFVR